MVGIKIPVIFSDHGALCNQLEDRKITLMRFLAAKLSKKIVALTNKTEKDYNRYFRIKKEKITTIYNPIETKFLTRKVKYTPSKKIIITVTRFGKEKGIDLLFNIAEKVLRKDKNIIWKVYGDGDLYKHYVSLATIKGIEKQLQLKGELKKIEEIYDEASLYALTSYREGLPVVLLEALGKNLPMISFDIETGPSEIISNEKNGILIPKYDIDLYADKILELLNNPLKLIKMSEDCEVKKSKFNLQEIAQKWYKVIETT